MKITKFHQSCLLIEANDKRILVDPGDIAYTDEMLEKYWTNIDCILVTHKHNDHCYAEVINRIIGRDEAKLYVTFETLENQSLYGAEIVKQGDIIVLGKVKIGVVRAEHGYLPPMKNKGEVRENVGYIIDAEGKSVYITSDTTCFKNGYTCDVICMPFNGNGLTMGIYDGILFAKATTAKSVIPVHLEHPLQVMNVDLEKLKNSVEEAGMEYHFLDIGESFEI
ncbi:MAG: MBL fold metallo-hydrolase [Clostridia bacterium]|nr:MBL fold metallo-hydrolase [Clostridia bacterium]